MNGKLVFFFIFCIFVVLITQISITEGITFSGILNFTPSSGFGIVRAINTSWQKVHDTNIGVIVITSFYDVGVFDVGSEYWIDRLFIPVNTSLIPDEANITGVNLSIYGVTIVEDNDGYDYTMVVGETTQASTSSLIIQDFDNCGAKTNPNNFSLPIDLSDLGSGSQWVNFSFTQLGMNSINKAGFSKLGLRVGHDALNISIDLFKTNYFGINKTVSNYITLYISYVVDDIVAPYWTNNASYIDNNLGVSFFNITWIDELAFDSAKFESNYSGTKTNYSMNSLGSNIYNYSVIFDEVGVYYWKSYANDTSNNINESDTWIFQIIDLFLPVVNSSLNKTSIYYGDVINITANATDETGLSFGQIIINDTGYNRYFNYSLEGSTQNQFSQNITINCYGGCVINFTTIVNDSANNVKINDTIITVVDNIIPFVNSSINNSAPKIFEVVNISANVSDEVGLSFCQFVHNQSGHSGLIYVNQTISGSSDKCSQSFTISLTRGNVINFTLIVNDTSNNKNQTDYLITVANTIPSLNTDLSFKNFSIGHSFNVTATFSDYDLGTDIISTTIENSTGRCYYVSNTTSGNDDFTVKFNCSGTSLTSTTIRINVTDAGNAVSSSSQLTNIFPNNVPGQVTLTNFQIYHSANLSYDINCSDADNDTITYYDNSTLFDINSSTGVIFNNPSQNNVSNNFIQILCGDGSANTSSTFWYNITNQLPTVASATITPTNATDAQELTCVNGSIADADEDAITLLYDWEKDGAWQTINNQVLGNGNTSVGENWRCKITPYDGLNNGSEQISGTVSIGTGFTAPSINWTNASTAGTGIESTSVAPTNNNSWVNLSVVFYDSNSDEKWSVYFCTSNAATASGCTVSTYCLVANSTSSSLSCRYNLSGTTEDYTYYAFVVDNESQISASKTKTFEVNFPPSTPTNISPSSNGYITVNYTLLNFTATDANSDVINYTIYAGSSVSSMSRVYQGNLSYYNWTNLTDATYFIVATATDEHGYSNGVNSSVYNFTIDTTSPSLDDFMLDASSGYTDETHYIYCDSYDVNGLASGYPKVTITDPNGASTAYAMTLGTGTQYVKAFVFSIVGNYSFVFQTQDKAGFTTNNISSLQFIASTRPSGGSTPPGDGGGGGGGELDMVLKFGMANILTLMQRAQIMLDDKGYLTRITSIDEEGGTVEFDIVGKPITAKKDVSMPIDLNDDTTPDVVIKITDVAQGQVAFFLDYYSEAIGECEENVFVHDGLREECEFACAEFRGCYFKEVGEQTLIARECGSRLLKDEVCIAESPIQYLLSEDYFQLEGVLNVVNVGIREIEGIPVEKILTVQNLESVDTIFVKFKGDKLSDIAEQKILPGQTGTFKLEIYPVRGRGKGFIDMYVQRKDEIVVHSIMYEMSIVTCKGIGVTVKYPEECCSKNVDEANKCVAESEKRSNVFTIIVIILIAVAFVAMVVYVASARKKGGEQIHFIPPK